MNPIVKIFENINTWYDNLPEPRRFSTFMIPFGVYLLSFVNMLDGDLIAKYAFIILSVLLWPIIIYRAKKVF